MKRRTQIALLVGAPTLLIAALAVITFRLQNLITERLQKGGALPPLELFAPSVPVKIGRKLDVSRLREELRSQTLIEDRDFFFSRAEDCARFGPAPADTSRACFHLREPHLLVSYDEAGFTREIWAGEPLLPTTGFALFPKLVTQFYDGQPILRQSTELAEVPLACLQAVTAIEDRDFLEHRGVSATGTLRALFRNLRQGRWAEGGSTITQQLVKNFFLTPKKTLRRKLEEQLLAVLLEAQLSKDRILEMYLNVIYMGQSGPFQVRGFGSAAPYYFGKPVARLELHECALLAAIINNPGRFNPVNHPEAARARREQVLRKMNEFDMVTAEELARAVTQNLPDLGPEHHRVNAPYFMMGALKEFGSWRLDNEEGVKLYVSLDADVQARLQDTAARILPAVEKRVRHPGREPLQTAIVTVDLTQNEIVGWLGGRDFKVSQYNRVIDSHRQIGSVVKPFVYYPALKIGTAMSAVTDEPFTWTLNRQTWKPRNFEKDFRGPVPYFFALAESLNVPAARVGQTVGLDHVVETLHASGLEEDVPALPSLTLGALELAPLDVAQMYSTVARLGAGEEVHTLVRAESASGRVLRVHQPSNSISLDPRLTAVLVGMMEQTFALGTARGAVNAGLSGAYAGKTGTTSDTKDAWFAGFDGRLLTVVWVGYDDNTPLGLTGAGAALPLWIDLTKKLREIYAPQDFAFPEGTEVRDLTREDIQKDFPDLKGLPERVSLVFAK